MEQMVGKESNFCNGQLCNIDKNLVFRKVPSSKEIPKILRECLDEACGGYFTYNISTRKALCVALFKYHTLLGI